MVPLKRVALQRQSAPDRLTSSFCFPTRVVPCGRRAFCVFNRAGSFLLFPPRRPLHLTFCNIASSLSYKMKASRALKKSYLFEIIKKYNLVRALLRENRAGPTPGAITVVRRNHVCHLFSAGADRLRRHGPADRGLRQIIRRKMESIMLYVSGLALLFCIAYLVWVILNTEKL